MNLEITVAKGTSFDISQSWVVMLALLLTRYVGYLLPFFEETHFSCLLNRSNKSRPYAVEIL